MEIHDKKSRNKLIKVEGNEKPNALKQKLFQVESLPIFKNFSKPGKYLRFFWGIIIFLAFICMVLSLLNIQSANIKYMKVPVHEIPFPAVTICPESKTQKSIINFSEAYHILTLNSSKNNYDDLSLSQVEALTQVCDNHLFLNKNINELPTPGEKFAELLRGMSLTKSEMLFICRYRNEMVNCSEIFQEVITDEGICYTFNILANAKLRHLKNVYDKIANESYEWDRDAGYKTTPSIDNFPYRALASFDYGLNIVFTLKQSDFDFICKGAVQGFKVRLHAPDEHPNMMDGFIRIPIRKDINVGLSSKILKTNQNCHSLESKKLKFFESYTQQNCLSECLSKFLIRECKCSKFSMVQDKMTKMCTQHETACVVKAKNDFFTTYRLTKTYPCGCKPNCIDIKYNSELSEANYDFESTFNAYNISFNEEFPDTVMSRLIIYFKNDYLIQVTNNDSKITKAVSFLSHFGGIMGFFLGASFLSVIEIFCVLISKIFNCIKK